MTDDRKPFDKDEDEALRKEGRQAVRNQSVVTPDDYPDDDGGKPDYRRKAGHSD